MRTNILPVSHKVASPVSTSAFCRSAVVTGKLTVSKQAVHTDMNNAVRCTPG